MRRWFFIVLLTVCASPVSAADIAPAPRAPPSITPPDPSTEKSVPDSPPSTHDPGMVKQVETVRYPDSVVTPPVIDPKMAVDPEAKTEEEPHTTLSPERIEPPKT